MFEIIRMDVENVNLISLTQFYQNVWNINDLSIADRIQKHTTYNGFNGFIAKTSHDEIIGFVYGYISLPGQYYRELLVKNISKHETLQWFDNCFELVELAVHPTYRKRGIGKQLLDHLFSQVTNQTAILTTQMKNIPARNLYLKTNWVVVKEPFYPSKTSEPFVIMGKKLR
ncbi:GNAT family N-acetyltransferase [Aquibacillus kalidii]|uniref:GNAT family N-acetyltransferase n=1 Tax=Aquibacillus kalidii TaxID=2762597 RepID=UPI00164923DC|nr:GNAT family N-acetyltransferase [Aquibacillus kalidii]